MKCPYCGHEARHPRKRGGHITQDNGRDIRLNICVWCSEEFFSEETAMEVSICDQSHQSLNFQPI